MKRTRIEMTLSINTSLSVLSEDIKNAWNSGDLGRFEKAARVMEMILNDAREMAKGDLSLHEGDGVARSVQSGGVVDRQNGSGQKAARRDDQGEHAETGEPVPEHGR